MPEGPMNIKPVPVPGAEEAEAPNTVEAAAEGAQLDLGTQPVQFPTHQPRLTAQGSATLKALQGR